MNISEPKPNNMKQATVNLPSGEYLIQEVPEGAKQFTFGWDSPTWLYYYPKGSRDSFDHRHIELPPHNWRLLGADPTNLTEEEAARVMDGYGVDEWRSYMKKPALESLSSLAESLGISKPYVILKNVEK